MSVPDFVQGCARFAVFLQKYFDFHILWSLSSVDFFLSQSKSQFQLDLNLRFVVVLDTLQSQWCRNIFLKVNPSIENDKRNFSHSQKSK